MKNKNDIIKHRLQKSWSTLNDAVILLNNQGYLSAVNRMYYAVFYALSAYLSSKDIIVKTHSGVKHTFHRELVSKHLVTADEAKVYSELFERRHEFDYNDFVVLNAEETKEMLNDAKLSFTK